MNTVLGTVDYSSCLEYGTRILVLIEAPTAYLSLRTMVIQTLSGPGPVLSEGRTHRRSCACPSGRPDG